MIPFSLLDRVYNTPLLITPEKWGAIMGVINRGNFDFSGVQLNADLVASAGIQTRPMSSTGRQGSGVAVVPVVGSLVARSSGFGGGSGLLSYTAIRQQISAAINDPEVGGVMLDMSSHGGEVAGCFALADYIREMATVKPIWAHINESAYSAGYAIAAACNRVLLSQLAGGGSIGVFMAHIDKSAKFEMDGENHTYIYSGAKKIDGNPNGPLDKRVLADLQAKVDVMRDVFASRVDAFRGLKPGAAKSTEAATYMGQELIAVGLADEVASYEEALEAFSANINGRRKKKMTTKERMSALIAANEDAESALAELGWMKADGIDAAAAAKAQEMVEKVTATNVEKVTAATNEIASIKASAASILEMCKMAGIPEMGAVLFKDGVFSVEAAAPLILAEKAAIDGKSRIESQVGSEVAKGAGFVEYMKKQHAAKA